tara:strand:- start:1228 stop:2202 length:975 start_codon:yes stop_codon:yes gene_type:complete
MKLLITGGAGYIGSHMVRLAQNLGHDITVLDNFSTGNRWAIKDCEILEVDLINKEALSKELSGKSFDGVIHFAAKSLVGESIEKPGLYYETNLVGTLNLVQEMLKNDINKLVFSSSAAIFGNPTMKRVSESHPKNPINPYGTSKLLVEKMLEDFSKYNELNIACLRYFNAAGADLSADIGEAHNPETHLIPNIIISALKNNNNLRIFGNNYDTPDGTCIRDYIHVLDLAQAHLLALEFLEKKQGFFSFNLGNGDGFSVLEVIKECEKVLNKKINYRFSKPRIGDPPILVADSESAKNNLLWKRNFSSLEKIIETAAKWHERNDI